MEIPCNKCKEHYCNPETCITLDNYKIEVMDEDFKKHCGVEQLVARKAHNLDTSKTDDPNI